MKRVLFLCTSNSCRSQMAEVLLNHLGRGRYEAVSAGAKPSGSIHPLAIRTLRDANLPIAGLRSKSWDEFKDQRFDFVVTVCDNAKESCPIFPGRPTNAHWNLEDPADSQGTDDEKMEVFKKVYSELYRSIQSFLAST